MIEMLIIMLSAGAGVFFKWLFDRPKTTAQIASLNVESAAEVVSMWKDTCERLERKVEFLTSSVEELTREIKDLRIERDAAKTENKQLKEALKGN